MTPATIARGLTAAQRRAITEPLINDLLWGGVSTMASLRKRGLIEAGGCYTGRLTITGQAVRAHLAAHIEGGGTKPCE